MRSDCAYAGRVEYQLAAACMMADSEQYHTCAEERGDISQNSTVDTGLFGFCLFVGIAVKMAYL